MRTANLLQEYANSTMAPKHLYHRHKKSQAAIEKLKLILTEEEYYTLRDFHIHYDIGHYDRATFCNYIGELKRKYSE